MPIPSVDEVGAYGASTVFSNKTICTWGFSLLGIGSKLALDFPETEMTSRASRMTANGQEGGILCSYRSYLQTQALPPAGKCNLLWMRMRPKPTPPPMADLPELFIFPWKNLICCLGEVVCFCVVCFLFVSVWVFCGLVLLVLFGLLCFLFVFVLGLVWFGFLSVIQSETKSS